MNKNFVIMLCMVCIANTQMVAMDQESGEILSPVGQLDFGCHNGCTAFALRAASLMLAHGAQALTAHKLGHIAFSAFKLYRAHSQGARGKEIEVDEELVSLHNTFYPNNSVRTNWDSMATLTAKMGPSKKSKYTILDALVATMRELEKAAVVITIKYARCGISLALGYDHGTWLFYDPHNDHAGAGGAYACTGKQLLPAQVCKQLSPLKTTGQEAFRYIRITFLEPDQLATGGPTSPEQEHLLAEINSDQESEQAILDAMTSPEPEEDDSAGTFCGQCARLFDPSLPALESSATDENLGPASGTNKETRTNQNHPRGYLCLLL